MSDNLILKVSQVNTYIQEMLDADDLLGSLCIRGELSNYKRYPSGHHYFTLKDETSSLKCVMFRSSTMRLRFRPENGMMVLAAGRISVYPRDGVYQLYCTAMMPDGAGDLSVAFEQLKKKLSAEGLFDTARKKPLPAYPSRIAIVTSSAGAAIHDMLRILRNRYPLTQVLLVPVKVQGEQAAGEIAAAIDYINRWELGDLIITGRGGGSLEDLWAFNEEIVARAISRSVIPVISAVGHEPDVTISDYVADVRAATPSNAAEIAVPDRCELQEQLDALRRRMNAAMQSRLRAERVRLQTACSRRVLQTPMAYVENRRQLLDTLQERMLRAFSIQISTARRELTYNSSRLEPALRSGMNARRMQLALNVGRMDAMSPLKVLSRGFSIVSTAEEPVVLSSGSLKPGDMVSIRFSKGSADAQIISCREES